MKKSELRQLIKEELHNITQENMGNAYYDRMEGLANMSHLKMFKNSLRELLADWMEEGFEREDVVEYVTFLIEEM